MIRPMITSMVNPNSGGSFPSLSNWLSYFVASPEFITGNISSWLGTGQSTVNAYASTVGTPPTFASDKVIFTGGGYLEVGINESADVTSTNFLPNGAQGQNPSGGWTNTGLDKLSNGKWLVGNDGRATAASSNLASLIILSADFATIDTELDMQGAAFANGGSIQGVAVEDDDSFWFAAPSEGKLINVDSSGVFIQSITAEAMVNGLAYDSINNSLWTTVPGSGVAKLYSIATGLTVASNNIDITAAADMLHYDSTRKLLAVSFGANSDAGAVLIYDVTNKLEAYWIDNITEVEAIEGIWIDYDNKTMAICHDGGFHTEVTPARSIIYTFDIDQEFNSVTSSNFAGFHLALTLDGSNPSNREALLAKDRVASAGTMGWAVYRMSNGNIRMQSRDINGTVVYSEYSIRSGVDVTFDGYIDIGSDTFYAEVDGVEVSSVANLGTPSDLASGINQTYYKIGASVENVVYRANCSISFHAMTTNLADFTAVKDN